jgi:hypothetical protein
VNNVGQDGLLEAATGWLHSFDTEAPEEAPRQGAEGAPDARLEIEPQFAEALLGMEDGEWQKLVWKPGSQDGMGEA